MLKHFLLHPYIPICRRHINTLTIYQFTLSTINNANASVASDFEKDHLKRINKLVSSVETKLNSLSLKIQQRQINNIEEIILNL